jgi:hypothetical protein
MAEHVSTKCVDCGQLDDHPKVVTPLPDEYFHHDCLPPRARHELMQHPKAAQVIKACEKGKKGDALRAHIAKLHDTQEG